MDVKFLPKKLFCFGKFAALDEEAIGGFEVFIFSGCFPQVVTNFRFLPFLSSNRTCS